MPKCYVDFASFSKVYAGTVAFLIDEDLRYCDILDDIESLTNGYITRSVNVSKFKGKKHQFLDIIIPNTDVEIDRLLLIGMGKLADISAFDLIRLGGFLVKTLIKLREQRAVIYLQCRDTAFFGCNEVTNVALGAGLAGYSFDKYKTIFRDEVNEEKFEDLHLTFATLNSVEAKQFWDMNTSHVLSGTNFARDLIIEPPNVLTTCEFVKRTLALRELGLEVHVLDQAAMTKLGMDALLSVGRGSSSPSYAVIMKWNGQSPAKAETSAPILFIGKGVVFDSGGISIKPSKNMQDMKGDMSGAACVVGLMYALAARRAKVNAIGMIGLVENMPGNDAQRPGDIVTSMSGQTIEIINTDAEGRLVLADLLYYAREQFKPSVMVDLATLTGAIVIALGKQHAGLFSNDPSVSKQLIASGIITGELVWNMPMGDEYDKMIDSNVADMKNAGERNAGSITASQFLKRFVGNVPWAHIDIAGTATDNVTEISRSWASGWGVRLLDRWVRDYHEGK